MLRARVGLLSRRRLLLRHADAIEAMGGRRRDDMVALAEARLEASGSADPGLLLRAARFARHDRNFPRVERLAGAALRGDPSAEAGLLCGEALCELGRVEDGEAVLSEAQLLVEGDEALVVLLAEVRSRNLLTGSDAPWGGRGGERPGPVRGGGR